MSIFKDIITFPLTQPVAIFLLVLVIILLTPIIFKRLKIPYIVGLIIAGMAVGPYGFNILERDASFRIFGEVGILYLMFMAAVEIDLFHLKQNYRQGLFFGLLSFGIPMIAGSLCCRYILGQSWLTSTLIASMYASHTLISYPVVTRFGLTRSRAVIIAVCGTTVSVFLALVVLAEDISIHKRGGFNTYDTLWLLVKVVAYIMAFGYITPKIARAFFKRANDHVTQFIFILCSVFAFSLAAHMIGLAGVLGAFYAGLVLNRFVPSRSPLMRHIEFVGNAIFIPYFLIGVGMLININVITKGWDVAWVSINMIIVSLAAKFFAAWIAGKYFRFNHTERNLIFGLSSGKAAATIAAVMIGIQHGLLDENIMNGAVLMIFACCLTASLVTEHSARSMKMELTEDELLHGEGKKVRLARQLVAVSNPITAENLMKLAVLMRNEKNTQEINLLFIRSSDDKSMQDMGKSALRKAADVALSLDLKTKEIERYDINVMSGLVNVMKELDCTDVIIGLHRKQNIVDSFYGSMTEQLLRSTNRMIILSRCFIPVNTIKRLMVFVPQKAEYETGFRLWVTRIGNLATQLGCTVDFAAHEDTAPYLRDTLSAQQFGFSMNYHIMRSWDDFIVLSSQLGDDDLLVTIAARRASISYNADLEAMPEFLSRYFSTSNLLIVYPDQFGDEEAPVSIGIDPLSQDISTVPLSTKFPWERLFGKLHIKLK